jgi:hypothetical protein
VASYLLHFDGMWTYGKPDIAAQVDKMRFEIQHFGLSRVGCKELKLLCSNVSATDEKIGIEQIAEWERWTFEYLPDGSVQFTSLPANTSIPVVSP